MITEDDYDLKTPAKLLAQNDRIAFHQSKSFDDISKAASLTPFRKAATSHEKHGTTSKRPGAGKLRRRSTMHWGSANPKQRQQKLEDVALDRIVNSWFSLHYDSLDQPIYISEVMEKSMNPSFSYFDLDKVSADVARSNEFTIRVWSKNAMSPDYKLLVLLSVNLRSLQFVGKSLENFHHPLPENCVLFHLSDGIYTSFTDLAAEDVQEPQLTDAQKSIPPINIASYDTLMKLANLDECIQDALHTREKLEADINDLLDKTKESHPSPNELDARRETVSTVKAALTAEEKQVAQLRKRNMDMRKARDQRIHALTHAQKSKKDGSELPTLKQKSIQTLRADVSRQAEVNTGQVRRICEDIQRIFPIEPIKNRTLQFTIRHIHLPNSVFDDTNRDEIAAALGFTAQLVYQLALYLSIPLPYPIEANGSISFIRDPMSMALAQRKFPLHPTNVNYKFEYGVFLLNKDIEYLMNRSGLRVLDIRHTLPNLKYLLYVLTAGTSELPARKAGGVRGLWAGAIPPTLSRRGSEDSVHSQESIESMNGNAAPSHKEKSGGMPESYIGFNRVKGLPYRSSLLREAG